MPRDFYPRPESKIVWFTANFSQRINTAPEVYGISQQQAEDYALLVAAFAQAHQRFNDPTADSSSNHAAKESARVALEKQTRVLARTIRARADVSDQMRLDLGLPARPVRRIGIPVPDSAPTLRVIGTIGGAIRIQLAEAGTGRRARPRDVRSAAIMGYVGENPPADIREWKLVGSSTSALAEARFDKTLPPGTKVWLTARWLNPTGQGGPFGEPIFTHLPYAIAPLPDVVRQAA